MMPKVRSTPPTAIQLCISNCCAPSDTTASNAIIDNTKDAPTANTVSQPAKSDFLPVRMEGPTATSGSHRNTMPLKTNAAAGSKIISQIVSSDAKSSSA